MFEFFSCIDYKQIVTERIKAEPKGGHGTYKKLASSLKISTTLVSQVFNGPKDLSLEQAFLVTKHFGFSTLETDYFVALVNLARAGNHTFKAYCHQQVDLLRQRAKQPKEHIQPDGEIDPLTRVQYYGDWRYTATRLAFDIKRINSANDAAELLGLPLKDIQVIVDFLLEHSLIEIDGRSYKIGKRHIHLDRDSPLFRMRQTQWRLLGLSKIDSKPQDSDLFYTSTVTLSQASANRIVDILMNAIKTVNQEVLESESEELRCLNLDWFKV